MHANLELPFRALRISLGLGAFLAGLDKFFNLLTQWEAYLSPLVTNVVPLTAGTLMRGVGVIEMIAGAIVLAGFTRLGGYVIAGWLLAVALSLVTTGAYFDVAVRDVVMSIAAFTLARLSEVRVHATAGVRVEAVAAG